MHVPLIFSVHFLYFPADPRDSLGKGVVVHAQGLLTLGVNLVSSHFLKKDLTTWIMLIYLLNEAWGR